MQVLFLKKYVLCVLKNVSWAKKSYSYKIVGKFYIPLQDFGIVYGCKRCHRKNGKGDG